MSKSWEPSTPQRTTSLSFRIELLSLKFTDFSAGIVLEKDLQRYGNLGHSLARMLIALRRDKYGQRANRSRRNLATSSHFAAAFSKSTCIARTVRGVLIGGWTVTSGFSGTWALGPWAKRASTSGERM
jgi:hypothetical protein